MSMESVRVDKWLWAVRIFKTRTASGRAATMAKYAWEIALPNHLPRSK